MKLGLFSPGRRAWDDSLGIRKVHTGVRVMQNADPKPSTVKP